MNDEEVKQFTLLKFHKEAIKIRECDDGGKVPDIQMKKIEDYKELMSSQLI